ncbi:beta-glucoside operon transcriptional antiterminator [Cytobacillus eiseniae]|uniref:Beta-glucoside operon transcriptional antiterminator n=1 Tax=Cytobacillus eiseniae TaxID=762947 RepID=A0ABS4RIC9_9BACI|nr:PRD domain-containing protein [Cytobacillus eiseniae]MBP2242156.1 beta-glucoside operon transcriptional antiterminator [Cytobacillus eiseniae]
MKIKKILNNNAVIVLDGGREKIAIGAGIAFNKRKNDLVIASKIEKVFIMRENAKLEQLLSRIPAEHFTISEEIITYAEHDLGAKLNEHIHVVLTDHLSFAIERTQKGIYITNKLLYEIKILYPREFEIGLWAIKHIRDKCQVEMPVDEAAFIALHLHTMKPQGGDLHQTIRQTTIIRDIIQSVKSQLKIEIEEDEIAYQRFISHLRFTLSRVSQYDLHTMDEELSGMIQKKFPIAYRCAKEIAQALLSRHGMELPKVELGYIALHIERLRRNRPLKTKIKRS